MTLATTNVRGEGRSKRFQAMRHLVASVNVQGVMGIRKNSFTYECIPGRDRRRGSWYF
jgi:hypothetical protein